MSAAWLVAGSWSEFALYSSRLHAHHRLCWLLVESDSGSSLDGHGVPGGGRSREGRLQAREINECQAPKP